MQSELGEKCFDCFDINKIYWTKNCFKTFYCDKINVTSIA